jgi:DNA-binding transcriptional LysR family regulator
MSLNLTQLRYFYLTARAASFAKACAQANITQPALSNAIKSLEDQIGFTLFDRSQRPIRLTPQGITFYDHVEKLLFQTQNVENSVRFLREGDEGHIRLGMTTAYASSLGGECVAAWAQDNPKMTLDIIVRHTSGLLAGLTADDLDIIVGTASEMQADAGRLDLNNVPQQIGCAYCRAGHPILDQPSFGAHDFQKYRLVASHYPESALSKAATVLGFDKPEDLPIAINSEDAGLLCDLATNSDLVLLSTRKATRQAVALGNLIELPLDLEVIAYWQVAKLKGRAQHPSAASLVKQLISVAH